MTETYDLETRTQTPTPGYLCTYLSHFHLLHNSLLLLLPKNDLFPTLNHLPLVLLPST